MPVPMIAFCFVTAMQKAYTAHTVKALDINKPIFLTESLFIYHLVLELNECLKTKQWQKYCKCIMGHP